MPTTSAAPLESLDDTKLEAVLETMFLAVYADGEFGDEERAEFRENVAQLVSGRAEGEALEKLLAKIEASAQGGRDARVKAIRAALPDPTMREMALGLAIHIMAADGVIRTSEREMILDIAEGLEVDRDRAADMVKRSL